MTRGIAFVDENLSAPLVRNDCISLLTCSCFSLRGFQFPKRSSPSFSMRSSRAYPKIAFWARSSISLVFSTDASSRPSPLARSSRTNVSLVFCPRSPGKFPFHHFIINCYSPSSSSSSSRPGNPNNPQAGQPLRPKSHEFILRTTTSPPAFLPLTFPSDVVFFFDICRYFVSIESMFCIESESECVSCVSEEIHDTYLRFSPCSIAPQNAMIRVS